MATQWHPIFIKVLRTLVQEHYDVRTNVTVSDTPREADILLLQRKAHRRPPFHGLWRHLTPRNVMEFKGRKVSPRVDDIPLLVELGLGIHRRLNEDLEQGDAAVLSPPETSFWYVANSFGRRFLRDAEQTLGTLELVTDGVWRCQVLRHPLFLVNSVAAPLERDTTPLHLLAGEPLDHQRELARLIVDEPDLWEMYGAFLSYLHPEVWEEAKRMARSKGKKKGDEGGVSLRPLIETVGVPAVVKAVGVEEFLKAIDIDDLFAHLTAEQLRELQKRAAKRG
jgi:hypothetical protein